MSVGPSDALCGWVAGARFADLPATTVATAKRVLLDATGVMIGASGMAVEAEPFVRLATAAGEGPCAILGTGRRVSAPMAALANGAFAHALDFEDSFDLAPGHPNASLVPVLLALAQAEAPVDGRRLLTALAVGCEVSCRMGLALRRPMEVGGWYPPPILAAYGAAAGAANLLGLSARQARDALSMVLCQATMPGEIKHSPDTVLRAVREAFPAQAAVQAALLARAGVTGFEHPLEGRSGFFALYVGGEFEPSALVDGLGEAFWIEQLTFKPWPSCRGTHPFIEMALELRRRPGFSVEAIARIAIEIDQIQQMLAEPLARKAAPATAIDAKFSIPFTLATALVRGRVGLDDFGEQALRDPTVQAIGEKVVATVRRDPMWQRGSGGALRIELADGRSLDAAVADALGCPARPLDEAALVAKFAACAGRARRPLDEAAAGRLAAAIGQIEGCADAGAAFA